MGISPTCSDLFVLLYSVKKCICLTFTTSPLILLQNLKGEEQVFYIHIIIYNLNKYLIITG